MVVSKGRSGKTVSGEYFRRLYRGWDDPWGFATSAYEREKYATTLAELPKRRYRSVLELACSVGVFTRLLAERCDALLGCDVSEDAVARASRRCADLRHVRFTTCDLASAFPDGRYDLVSFCEVGFYFGPRDLARIRDDLAGALEPGGDLVLVHWTPLVEGHAQTADDVHDAFLRDRRFVPRSQLRVPTYRLDVLRRS